MNTAINQLNLIDIYRSLNPTKEESIFFSSTYGTFFMVDHEGHKTSLNKFNGLEVRQDMFSDHSAIKFCINNIKKLGKSQISGN